MRITEAIRERLLGQSTLSGLVGEAFNLIDAALDRQSQRLGLPQLQEERSERVTFRVTPEAGVVTVQPNGRHVAPFQLVPYSQRGSAPIPDDVLEYTIKTNVGNNDDGTPIIENVVFRGIAIKVGTTNYPLDMQTQQYVTGDPLQYGTSDKAIRKLRMALNLASVNDAKTMINVGQLMAHINIQVQTE